MTKSGHYDENSSIPEDPQLLSRLTEYTEDALWMFTPDFEDLVFVNSAYADIFGQSVAELESNPSAFVDAVHTDDVDIITEGMAELSSGKPVDIEFRANPETDYQTWIWVQGKPIFDDAGELEYLAGYSRDITDRKTDQRKLEQHREELERSNESLREFAYIASHDLQEPLRMVSSYVDLLDMEYGDQLDEEATEYMEFAVNGARRMKRMINSLLEYSRVHTDAGELEPIDANAVFEDTRRDLELLISDRNATVSVGDLPTLDADRAQLGQIFQNLMKNAIEHAGKGTSPEIEMDSTERDLDHLFVFSDNGPGIPEGEQGEVFKIFQKGASSKDGENTGIGLAITQRIVQRHGGSIWIEPDSETGATFKFTIPRTPNQSAQEDVES